MAGLSHREEEAPMTGIPTGPAQAVADPFTATQRYYWRIALELRLRKANSDAFQNLFSTVMGLLHGDDFVRVCFGFYDAHPWHQTHLCERASTGGHPTNPNMSSLR